MEPANEPRLSRDQWIATAYAAFQEGGIDAVKADRLAKSLGVTRGSFYWHFKNVADLMRDVLELWRNQQTETVIQQNERAGGDAASRLLRLLETCARDDGRFEIGIRLWMARDRHASALVGEVDARRTAYLAELLAETGLDEAKAVQLAPVAYAAWLGEYSGAITRTVEDRVENMRVLFALLINAHSILS